MSVVGVVLAVLGGFVVGFVWFGPKTFFPVWWRAMGRGDDRPGEGMNMAVVFGATLAALIVEALVIAGLIGGLYPQGASAGQGLVVGLLVGVGVAAMPSLGHRLFAGQGWLVWVLEIGADVLAASVMGVLLAVL